MLIAQKAAFFKLSRRVLEHIRTASPYQYREIMIVHVFSVIFRPLISRVQEVLLLHSLCLYAETIRKPISKGIVPKVCHNICVLY